MSMSVTFTGDALTVRQQMQALLNGEPSITYSVAREEADANMPDLRKTTEAATANAEQYDADKAAKEQEEKAFAEAQKAEKATRQTKPKAEPAAESIAEQVQEPVAEEAAPAVTLDYTKDVAPAVLAYANANGREKTLALLGEFGATSAKEIPQALWSELLERLGG